MAHRKAQPFFDARGRLLLERRGLPRSGGLASDAYHAMRTASWTAIAAFFMSLFLTANVVFAVILWAGHAEVLNARGFPDYFWFSVQTMGTIGFGYLAPMDTLSNVVVTVESFTGIVLTAMVTGIFFARFATPSPRVIFSKVAVIADYDGTRMLMFRMANARATAIVEAVCHVYISRDEFLRNGERVRRIHDLALRRNTSPIFNLSWVAYHALDESSPLYGVTPADLIKDSWNVIVTFQGIDDRLAATVHTRYAYNPDDIVFDRRFVDIFKIDPVTGVRYLDFEPFHDTEPLLPASAVTISASPGGPE